MKNIFILPTCKQSRLYNNNGQLHLDNVPTNSNGHTINQNVYITSDEGIKDSWILNTHTNEVYFLKGYYGIQPITKKIILTTDPDLIKGGVQAIDNEFLEWLVKNPSCTTIKTVRKFDEDWSEESGAFEIDYYKIIIPKEEPKQQVEKKQESDYKELLKQVVWKLHEAQTFNITIERDGRNATWEAETSMDGQFVEASDIIDIANWIEKEIS